MLLEQLVISLCHGVVHPCLCGLVGVHAHVCLRIAEIRVKVDLVVGVGSNVEAYLIGVRDVDLAVAYELLTALGNSLYTNCVLHAVVVERSLPHKAIVAVSLHLALRYRVRCVAEHEVLHAGLACCVLHYQCVGRVRYKVVALVVHAVLVILHHSQCRVKRKDALVVAKANHAVSGLDVELTHCGEVTETEWLLTIVFVRCCTVEVLACELCRLLVITVKECLANVVEQVSRLLVHVPVVLGTLLCVRATAP